MSGQVVLLRTLIRACGFFTKLGHFQNWASGGDLRPNSNLEVVRRVQAPFEVKRGGDGQWPQYGVPKGDGGKIGVFLKSPLRRKSGSGRRY